ncbi:MAG: mechanosensitive ion channel [Candidatus Omnitrophica bacterium]|nr:mechanosensitive ion channel [Candidatus Omnitrophota bacterium]
MVSFQEVFQNVVVKTFERLHMFAMEVGPKILVSIVILLIGWICAVLIKKAAAKILKALGLDVVSEKTGLRQFLERGGTAKAPSAIVGLGLYWLIILSTLIMAFNTLELYAASEFIKQIILYIPNVMVFLIFVILGIFLGRFFGKVVEKTAHLVNAPFPVLLSRATAYTIVGLAIVVALEQLGVNTAAVIQASVVIFIIVPIIFSIVFIIGGREIASSILAQRFIVREYKIGNTIEFDGISGKIEHIDFISTKIKDNGQEIIIPNSELARKIVRKKA